MKVSIASITYNHENYIRQALDSWLSQECDFETEIIIGDDCSKDSTQDIIRSYQEKYPEKIRLIANEKNVGHQRNLYNVLKECTGDYIAICAGDDYWIDNHKLKKQVDCFSSNSDATLVFTSCLIDDGAEAPNRRLLPYNEDLSFDIYEYLAQKSGTASPSMMIKPPDFDSMNLDNWFNTMLEDEYLYSVMMRNGGLAYFLADNTTCYRIHNSGLNSKQSLAKQVYFKIRLLHNIKLEFQDDKKALSIIHQTIKERMEPLFHYTFEGVKGIPRFDLIRLFLRYRTRVFIDLRLYYNWYLKRLFGR